MSVSSKTVLVSMLILKNVVGLSQQASKFAESRRDALSFGRHALLGGAAFLTEPKPSQAIDIPKLSTLPEIPRVPRQDLNQQFAVLLMRSSYNTVDELDFIAMDQFQKDFFLRRQDEWEKYTVKAKQRLGRPPMQGDLTDATYFDFISFAQYETINAALAAPKSVFNELQTAEGDSVVIARGADGVPDQLLASTHSERVGNAILDYILDTYNDIDLNGPLLPNIQQLFQWFAVNGFAADSSVSLSSNPNSSNSLRPSTLEIRLLAPANLWSLQALTKYKRPLTNDFVAKALAAYLSRRQGCAFDIAKPSFIDGATSTLHRCQILSAASK